jgi:hypothetical protein
MRERLASASRVCAAQKMNLPAIALRKAFCRSNNGSTPSD